MNSIHKKQLPLIDELINERRTAVSGGSGFILGCPGSGKTQIAQQQILSILKNTEDSIVVFDTDGTFSPWAEEVKGQIVKLSPIGPPHINPFDINIEAHLDVTDAMADKSDFIITWIEAIMGTVAGLSPSEKSIIDRVTRKAYAPYLEHKEDTGAFDKGLLPTLKDFYSVMKNQVGYEAYAIAEAIRCFISGSINIFSNTTDLQHNNRLVTYTFSNLSRSLLEISSLAALEHIWINFVEGNQERDKNVWLFIDDAYYLMLRTGSQHYLSRLYKKARTHSCIFTSITQNLSYIFEENCPMRQKFSNSGYIHICRLPPLEKNLCAQLLNLTSEQVAHITNSPPGQSLVYTGGKIIEVTSDMETKTIK